jgi:NAD+ synthase
MRTSGAKLPSDPLAIDCAAETARIAEWIRATVATRLRRRGIVIAVSGGVDSAVCAALAVRAIGANQVFALMMPERDSSTTSASRGTLVAERLGIRYQIEPIGATLDALGCYRWRDDAIRTVFPAYAEGWKNKIAIAGGADGRINFFNLVVQTPAGQTLEKRLPIQSYLQIVAATNYKQRVRKAVEYFHADRLHYAVLGTPNRLEYDQGFFVKNGDGAADFKPIAHLYKTQVYAMARHLGVPDVICSAEPTTDTYSLHQGQDEFFFALPYAHMDVALWSYVHGVSAADLATRIGVSLERAEFVYRDIAAKRNATAYLHADPLLIETVLPDDRPG